MQDEAELDEELLQAILRGDVAAMKGAPPSRRCRCPSADPRAQTSSNAALMSMRRMNKVLSRALLAFLTTLSAPRS